MYALLLLCLGVYLSTGLLDKELLGSAFPCSVVLLNGLKPVLSFLEGSVDTELINRVIRGLVVLSSVSRFSS